VNNSKSVNRTLTILSIGLCFLGSCSRSGTQRDSASGAELRVRESAPIASVAADRLERYEYLTVTCGPQLQAKGRGAAANEVVKVRIREQVANGIDISREVVADANGIFIMNDYCDPTSPNAEVPALWSYVGVTSGRTGENLVQYKLDPKAPKLATPPTT
jgi:hypothetical protein